jgi:hypothetical protein
LEVEGAARGDKWAWYAVALLCFVAALFSKTQLSFLSSRLA